MPHAGHSHMMLLHRLQKRRLRAGARPVDFVRHQQLSEDRPADKAEGPSAVEPFFHDFGAEDVGRHQVGGELHAQGVESDDDAQGLDQLGLGEPRHPDQQAVPAGEEDRQREIDDALLTEDDGADLGPGRRNALEGRVDLPRQQADLGGVGGAHRIVLVVTEPLAVSLWRKAH